MTARPDDAAPEEVIASALFAKVFGGPYLPRVHGKYAAAHPTTIKAEIAKLEAAGMASAVDVIAALIFFRDVADNRAEFIARELSPAPAAERAHGGGDA